MDEDVTVVACITARMSSERLPGKVMADIGGKPALERIVDRFVQVQAVDVIVIATSTDPSDDPIEQWALDTGLDVYRGSLDDVCTRIYHACKKWDPDYILRGLGDCTFIEPRLLDMMIDVVSQHGADTARVVTPPNTWPVYGAAESCYSWSAVRLMQEQSRGPEREHFGMHLDRYRSRYNVIYPIPHPSYYSLYFRPYRLELDTEADLCLMREIYARMRPYCEPPLHSVIRLLDTDPDLAVMNVSVAEKTGPLTSYSAEDRRTWALDMVGNVIDWPGDWSWLEGRTQATRAIWCDAGTCYMGSAVHKRAGLTVLHRPNGSVIEGTADLACRCGAGRRWYGGQREKT